MKYLALAFPVLLSLLPACASVRTISADNNVVEMPTHSFTIPPDRGWVCQEDRTNEHTYLKVEDDKTIYVAGVFLREVAYPELIPYTADELAALYFDNEQLRVLQAEDGRFQITESVAGTEEIGGEVFHTLAYTTVGEEFEGQTFLFLRIPFPRDNGAIVAVEMRQAAPAGPPLEADPARLEDVRAIAASLKLDEVQFAP